jgi:hypothetical protein
MNLLRYQELFVTLIIYWRVMKRLFLVHNIPILVRHELNECHTGCTPVTVELVFAETLIQSLLGNLSL